MADPEQDERALGDEALRRGLLTKENLDEARETQRLAVEAGLPITLTEVLLQRKYLNTIQIETLQQRLHEPAQRPVPAPQEKPPSGDKPSRKKGDSTRALPPHPLPRKPTSGPKRPVKPPSSVHEAAGPFPPIPSARPSPPTTSTRTSSKRIPRTATPATATPSVTSPKRGSGRAPGVAVQPHKRGTSISADAVSPAPPPDMPPRQRRRTSSRIAAAPPLSPEAPAVPSSKSDTEENPGVTKPAAPKPARQSSKRRLSSRVAAPVADSAAGSASEKKPEGTTPDTSKTAAVTDAADASAAPQEPPRRKRRAVLWFFVVLLLLGGGAGVWMLLGRPSIPPQPDTSNLYGPTFAPTDYWLIVGPFPAKDGRDLDKMHEPEREGHQLTATFKGAKKPLKWKLAKTQKSTIDLFNELGKPTNCVGYGLSYIECSAKTKALLGIGSDDGVKVWLNGKQVHRNPSPRSCVVNQDRVTVTLEAGVNEIFIKVAQGTGQWAFAVTIRNPNDKPLPGLKGRLPKGIRIPKPGKPSAPAKPKSKPSKPKVQPARSAPVEKG